MALQKTFTHNSGASATYWRIIEFNINYASKTGRIALGGYIDEQSRLDGNVPLMQKNFGITADDITTYFSEEAMAGEANNLSQGYLMIKELTTTEVDGEGNEVIVVGEFADALDV